MTRKNKILGGKQVVVFAMMTNVLLKSSIKDPYLAELISGYNRRIVLSV